ncbi:lysophospholipid acyltransferase family protein [Rhabdothermincola salaria]|uniref:lysophospholipid acyltransferase family protein n=1 Tax=Rhabdothermincola salaria TaxID=2903142 RepID=UPI001E3F55AF|nr:lysophospholipid acyltransferase family protein [Rhabdothermincola salaria]MCD9623122.1 1-acyl-sn-glycerol-3-phosphate acyltransferase [Rhabdothermincola salaria]
MTRRELHVPAGHELGEDLSRSQRIFYAVMRALIAGGARLWFRLEVHGRENIPATGPFIVSPIHRSNVDTPLLAPITRRRLRYMGKESLWTSRFGGWFLTSLGGFPVERGTADRDALRASMTVIERGEPLVMFPEGTRQSGPEIAKVFDGPSYVACRTGAPILPVGIGGSERAMAKGSKWVRPVKIVIVVGTPITPPPKGENGRVPRRAVREVTSQLAVAIQALFDEAQALAGSPNRHG